MKTPATHWPTPAKVLAGTLLALAIALIAAAAVAFAALRASLPQRSGTSRIDSLRAPVAVQFDRHGVPRIRADNIEDAFRAQGFLHAQERFFQMDLARRASAGELAALVGKVALQRDIAQRRFELRRHAREVVAALPARHRAWLQAYAQGVNAGLAALKARPPEYWLLRQRPAPWKIEDSVLVMYSFYTMLSQNQVFEKPQGVMRATLPAALYDFLTPSTSRFDRLLVPPAGGGANDYVPEPIPPSTVVDLSRQPPRRFRRRRVQPPLLTAASNQWAVDSGRGANGEAILANDPHLQLRVPNVFYRTELYWPGGTARGVGIAGLPGIMIGATRHLAWGATVSNADQSDWVVIELDPRDPSRYRVPGGFASFTRHAERIAVAGGAPVTITVRSTRYGPVADHDWRGRPLALHATWLQPGGANFDLLDLMTADSVAAGESVLARWAGPSLNWMLAGADGKIGWIVNGPLPRRVGFDGSVPESWADGKRGWQGEQPPPRLIGSADGALFTANNRTLPLPEAARLSRMWMRPLRAQRIGELLSGQHRFDERAFLRMQLDTKAEAYDAIRDVVLEVVPANDPSPLLREARAEVQHWDGRADASQSGFRVLNVYYRALIERTIAPLLAPAIDADRGFVYRWPLADEVLRRLLEARPPNLLSARFHDWPSFLRSVLLDTLRRVQADPSRLPIDAPWGEVNRLDVAHPFGSLPLIGRWLRVPAQPQPGSMVSLRVAAPRYGAVIRMDVSPSDPSHGILEMFGGQSGDFLSPNFDDLEQDWHTGRPTPFLAGPTVSTLSLRPQ